MLFYKVQANVPVLFKAVGLVCFYRKTVLLLKRNKDKSFPDCWGLPSGRLRQRESEAGGAVRELFEETGILISSDNITETMEYHIINNELSYVYTVFKCDFITKPKVTIKSDEHVTSEWVTIESALDRRLVPDLSQCLIDAEKSQKKKPIEINRINAKVTAIEKTINRHLNQTLRHDLIVKFNNETIYISFGPPCTGKSTIFKAISSRYDGIEYIASPFSLDFNNRLNLYLRKAFIEKDRRYFYNFQMDILLARFLVINHDTPHCLLDESIFSTLAYSRALYSLNWLTDDEYKSFYSYYLLLEKMLPIDFTIICFDCDLEVLMQRIRERNKEIEKKYSERYVKALRQSFREVANELSKSYNFIYIDSTNSSVEENINKINSIIKLQ